MKCEKCGNEATFHYQSDINNVKTEYHLCEECSKKEGFGDMFEQTLKPMLSGFWGTPAGMLNSFMNPFSPFASGAMIIPAFTVPMLNVFAANPEASTKAIDANADNISCEHGIFSHVPQARHEIKYNNRSAVVIPKDAGEGIRAKREMSALRSQMEQAVKAEEFEKAAQLRDKIREMEK